MSRAQRRATMRGGGARATRSRRTPVKAAKSGRFQVPWVPVLVVAGIAGIAGLAIYLVIQATKPFDNSNEEAQRIEADANPNLPGAWVNLAELWGDGEGYSATATHVREDVDYAAKDQELPPTGGHHWGHAGRCPTDPDDAPLYCGPVPGGFYVEPWRAESLVHNMEHAGVVVWYNTENQEVLDDLRDFAQDHSNANLVVSPYPDMEKDTVAITSWSRRLKVPVSEYDRDAFNEFFDVHNCRFDPEDLCDT